MKFKIALGFGLIAIWGLAGDFKYVGTFKCKVCHKKDEKGNQWKAWTESKHSKIYDTLKTEKAIQYAKEAGLKKHPTQEPECLECHVVGLGKGGFEIKDEAFWNPADDDKKGKKAKKRMEGLKNAGCETCHGPGSIHVSRAHGGKGARPISKHEGVPLPIRKWFIVDALAGAGKTTDTLANVARRHELEPYNWTARS